MFELKSDQSHAATPKEGWSKDESAAEVKSRRKRSSSESSSFKKKRSHSHSSSSTPTRSSRRRRSCSQRKNKAHKHKTHKNSKRSVSRSVSSSRSKSIKSEKDQKRHHRSHKYKSSRKRGSGTGRSCSRSKSTTCQQEATVKVESIKQQKEANSTVLTSEELTAVHSTQDAERLERSQRVKLDQNRKNKEDECARVDEICTPVKLREDYVKAEQKVNSIPLEEMGEFKTPEEVKLILELEQKLRAENEERKAKEINVKHVVPPLFMKLNNGFFEAPVNLGSPILNGKKMEVKTKRKLGNFNFESAVEQSAQKEKVQILQRKQFESQHASMSSIISAVTQCSEQVSSGSVSSDCTQPFNQATDIQTEKNVQERFYLGEEVYSDEDLEEEPQEDWLAQEQAKGKGKELKKVDHSKITYPDIQKNFYIESPEIRAMSKEEVKEYRAKELEGVVIRGKGEGQEQGGEEGNTKISSCDFKEVKSGKGCPRPIKKWIHCGLAQKLYKQLEKEGMSNPFPVQAQAIPAIMSGRDVIACAKTGSGKTLAYVLPMLRHIQAQPPLSASEGPIGVVMCPTRELAVQIDKDIGRFANRLFLRHVVLYGGASIAAQINALKAGAEIITCTPGRMIAMLCANNGRVTNLSRCSYCVLDEADRMFDMGFAPSIEALLDNMRPDRQTVMFSATFPRTVEILAKKALSSPIED